MSTLDRSDKVLQDEIVDIQHPTDKNRTLLKDSKERIENYLRRKEKQTGHKLWDTSEVSLIRMQLRDEYFPKPVKREPKADDTYADTK